VLASRSTKLVRAASAGQIDVVQRLLKKDAARRQKYLKRQRRKQDPQERYSVAQVTPAPDPAPAPTTPGPSGTDASAGRVTHETLTAVRSVPDMRRKRGVDNLRSISVAPARRSPSAEAEVACAEAPEGSSNGARRDSRDTDFERLADACDKVCCAVCSTGGLASKNALTVFVFSEKQPRADARK